MAPPPLSTARGPVPARHPVDSKAEADRGWEVLDMSRSPNVLPKMDMGNLTSLINQTSISGGSEGETIAAPIETTIFAAGN